MNFTIYDIIACYNVIFPNGKPFKEQMEGVPAEKIKVEKVFPECDRFLKLSFKTSKGVLIDSNGKMSFTRYFDFETGNFTDNLKEWSKNPEFLYHANK